MKSLNPVRRLAPVIDVLAIVLAGILANEIRFDTSRLESVNALVLIVMALAVVLINLFGGGYSKWRSTRLRSRIYRLLWVWAAVFAAVSMLMFLLKLSDAVSRQWLVFTFTLSFCLVAASRALLMMLAMYHNGSIKNRRKVFLVGPEENLLDVARSLRQHQEQGYAIAGVCRGRVLRAEKAPRNLARRVEKSGADEVWICLSVSEGEHVKAIMYNLRHLPLEIRFIPHFADIPLLNHRVSHIAGTHAIDLSVSPISGSALWAKRLEDIIIGGLILLLIAPVCAACAVAVKLSSPGPVLFKQLRTGANGHDVQVYKFRSMKIHQEKSGHVSQATRRDPRITRVGAFLRRTSLDELPQFLNVIQGRMSIVGPRPHALAHNEYYKDLVESYMQRHMVKPGITGWAQVCGFRGETDTLDKMQHRVEHDLWYINNWSLLLDLKIIFLTVFKGFTGNNAY
ncbi:undecaprenyl-phosphate glucose phosphotransferase [Salinicola socius]|uniref:Undecaprenyl-phosphate glucose phosphotransferase n=1 Tax=Salinicola socius TaxID=404433 RepID=A0A1Q8SPR9_9GAMM|nr:undecaprenyl-phosphate glucose phosphotransferase [Salinicola socius]OLO03412.1 undecaprenyl-phosphate glucose phosphotransferase [Salinicola socius]